MHCASLLRMNLTSLVHANEHVHMHDERNFPQDKLDSKIKVRFHLNEHGNLYFLYDIVLYAQHFLPVIFSQVLL